MIIIIEKDSTSSCNKKTRLIFENVTKQSRFKNPARNSNVFPFLLQSLYVIIIIIIRNVFYYLYLLTIILNFFTSFKFIYLLFTIILK